MDEGGRSRGSGSLSPGVGHQGQFVGGQHVEFVERQVRIRQRRLQQAAVPVRDTPGGVGLVEVRGVVEEPPEAVGVGREVEAQIELGGARVHIETLGCDAGQVQSLVMAVVDGHDHLEHGEPAAILPGDGPPHQFRERHVPVPHQLQYLTAGRRHQVAEGNVGGHSHAQGQQVAEATHQPVQVRTSAPRDGGPQDHVVDAAVPVHQCGGDGGEDGEGCGACGSGECPYRLGHLRGNPERDPAAPVTEFHRARTVGPDGRALRQVPQAIAPVAQRVLVHGVCLLPGRVGAELQRRRQKLLRAFDSPRAMGAVEVTELLVQEGEGPVVHDEVVDQEGDDPLLRTGLHQSGAYGPSGEIQRPGRQLPEFFVQSA